MGTTRALIPAGRIAQSIHLPRGQKVMLDGDLAAPYEVPTGHLNRAVKRNLARFPSDFMFRINRNEARILKCQFGISSWGGRRGHPYAFTEQGVAMLSSVLNSARAVKVNIAIMRAFVKLRETLDNNRELGRKFIELQHRVGKHDEEIAAIIDAIRPLMAPPAKPRREIGFHVREKSPRYRTRNRR
jgi:ORF6N domain